jgi:predicted NBD/HSP70 family sugar kinase
MATSSIARKINEVRVLRTLFENGHMSRADVARGLGLTKSTMTNVVGELLDDKLIGEFDQRNGRGRVGRPGIMIGLNPKGAYFLGAEIRATQIKVVALDLTAQRVGMIVGDVPEPRSPAAAFTRLKELVNELCRNELPATATIKGLCVALPGFVTLDGVLLRTRHIGWRDLRVREQLRKVFRWPVLVENDANLAAFGEWYLNGEFRNRHIALVSMTDGVGCGFVAGGRIARGAHGLSGEIGHLILNHQIDGDSVAKPMTWEQAVEKQALIAAYTRRTGRSITLQQLLAGVGADDPVAVDVTAAWARWMAYGLVAVAYSHDPDDIIIAGEMAPLFAACRGVVEQTMREILIEGFPMPNLATSTFGEDACAAGAASLVHHSVFDTLAIEGIPS